MYYIIIIGITEEVNIFELNAIVQDKRENIFLTTYFDRLYQLLDNIIPKVSYLFSVFSQFMLPNYDNNLDSIKKAL